MTLSTHPKTILSLIAVGMMLVIVVLFPEARV